MDAHRGKNRRWVRIESGVQVAGVLGCYNTAGLQRAAGSQWDVRHMKQ